MCAMANIPSRREAPWHVSISARKGCEAERDVSQKGMIPKTAKGCQGYTNDLEASFQGLDDPSTCSYCFKICDSNSHSSCT